jgi:creatinine amidohydrolase
MTHSGNYAGRCTSPEFAAHIKNSRGVILVCGSCEQHGHHLPLDTDNIIGQELALRIAEKTGMLVMPPVNYGQVWSAKGFPGTISLPASTLKQILRDIICSLEAQQVRNIVLMSGHNGNMPILKDLARELMDEFGWRNIWYFPMAMSKEVARYIKTPIPMNVAHAGEIETAMMLYLRPELVHMDRATREFPKAPEEFAYRPMRWNEVMETGSFGDGGAATVELGKALIESAVDTTAALIERLLK